MATRNRMGLRCVVCGAVEWIGGRGSQWYLPLGPMALGIFYRAHQDCGRPLKPGLSMEVDYTVDPPHYDVYELVYEHKKNFDAMKSDLTDLSRFKPRG